MDVASNAFYGCEQLVIACEESGQMSEYARSAGIPYYVIGEPEPFHMITAIDLPVQNTAMRAGEGFMLEAYVLPQDASLPQLAYTSSNPAAVTVSREGYVHALAPGYAIITVRAQDGSGQTNSCMVTVHPSEDETSPVPSGVIPY